MLTGEQLAAIDGAVADRDAAGFAAEDRLALEDANLEAPLRKLVRRAQAADTTTQDGDRPPIPVSCLEGSLLGV